MTELFNKVSNSVTSGVIAGNAIIPHGDTVVFGTGQYQCTAGNCAGADEDGLLMLYTNNLHGEFKCSEDVASCVLDGTKTRRLMRIDGTGGGKVTIRAITFKNGGGVHYGGGIYFYDISTVDVELCVFSNCRATEGSWWDAETWGTTGGGALYVDSKDVILNIYGTHFSGNTAESGNGGDIYNDEDFISGSGSVTIHNTCPSPYSCTPPIQGKLRKILWGM